MLTTSSKIGFLFPETRWKVLRELVIVEPEMIHVREIARKSGLNAGGVGRELKRLEEADIVESKKIGNLILYRLNTSCQVYVDIKNIVIKTIGIADMIYKQLRPYQGKISFAYIYGSYAKDTHDTQSDIDLMIVGDLELEEISRCLDELEIRIRREINPTIFTKKEYQKQIAKKNSFLAQVNLQPKIMLFGESDES